MPQKDDQTLFEFITLEGAQAGLAWITVLRKREGYRALFDNFDANKIARYTDKKLDKLSAHIHILPTLMDLCNIPYSSDELDGIMARAV